MKSHALSLFLFFSFASCALKKENEPIIQDVRIDFEHLTRITGWEEKDYYTGRALRLKNDKQYDPSNRIVAEVRLKEKGDYQLWLLAALDEYDKDIVNHVEVSNGYDTVKMQLDPMRALNWRHGTKDFPAKLHFPEAGVYQLTFHATHHQGFNVYLDRFVLTNDKDFFPRGYANENPQDIILPPAWAFGVIYGGYTNQSETRTRVERLIKGGFPIDAYWIDSWFWDYTQKGHGPEGYIDFKGDLEAYPDVEGLWSFMEDSGVKSGIWVWDLIHKEGQEAVFADFEDQGYFSSVFHRTEGWHNKRKDATGGNVDFANPRAAQHWKQSMQPFFSQGLDFLKLDRTSAVPFLKAAFEATQELGTETQGRGFIMSHLHTTYDPEAKKYPTKWSGDAKITWSQEDFPNMNGYSMGGLKENVRMVADPLCATYENPFLTNDTGGYNFFGSDDMGDSLYIRWVQFSMLNPITSVFSTADNSTANMPFNFSPSAQEVFRYYSHLKMQLFPYIYTYAHLTRETGVKMIRGDGVNTSQYYFGNELLVAPVVESGAKTKRINLPNGQWIDFYSGKVFQGGENIDFAVTLDRIPLFAKAGSIIPMRKYSRTVELGNNHHLTLYIYPQEKTGEFTLYEDDGLSNQYMEGKIARSKFSYRRNDNALQIGIHATEGTYNNMPGTRQFTLQCHVDSRPKSITVDGIRKSFEFIDDGAVLVITTSDLKKNQDHQIDISF